MTQVRERSRYGACNVLGELAGETATRYIYRLRGGETAFVLKRTVAIHLKPCNTNPHNE
jgi:hypothetical protein